MTKKEEGTIIGEYYKWLRRMERYYGIMDVDIQDVIRRFENRKNKMLKNLSKELEEDKQ
jgi:hypothetical protein